MSPGRSSACGSFQKLFLLQFTMSTVSIETFQVSILPDCFLPCVPVFLKMCYIQYVFKFGKPSSGHRTGKGQSSSEFARRAVLKKAQTTRQFSHASKVILKTLQARLQYHVNGELPDVQAGFSKAKEPEIKLPTFAESKRKQGSSRKTSTSVFH